MEDALDNLSARGQDKKAQLPTRNKFRIFSKILQDRSKLRAGDAVEGVGAGGGGFRDVDEGEELAASYFVGAAAAQFASHPFTLPSWERRGREAGGLRRACRCGRV